MTLIQELMNQAAVGGLLNTQTIKRFSPAEIRETIQSLVATEQIELASALGDAGMSIYPHSEDMLAINSLLAMVRALRCNLEPARALEVVRRGLALYPEQLELMAEKLALDDFSESMMPIASVGQKH